MKLKTTLLAAACALALTATIGTAPALASGGPTVQSQAKHFAECLQWMVTDPAKHAQFCSPGHDVWVHGTTEFGGDRPVASRPCN